MVCPEGMLDTFNFGLLILLWKTIPDTTGLHWVRDHTKVSSSVHIVGKARLPFSLLGDSRTSSTLYDILWSLHQTRHTVGNSFLQPNPEDRF